MLALLLFTVYITAVSNSSVWDWSSAECWANIRSSARKSSQSDLWQMNYGESALMASGFTSPSCFLALGIIPCPSAGLCAFAPFTVSQLCSGFLRPGNEVARSRDVLPGRGTSWVLRGLHSCYKICQITSCRSLEWAIHLQGVIVVGHFSVCLHPLYKQRNCQVNP